MAFADVSMVGLKVFREVAARGTLTAAAAALGYTQSAVSRQIAALERAVGVKVLDRQHNGVRLTGEGRIVLRRAAAILDEVDAAARELRHGDTAGTVRLGWFASAGAAIVPGALALLRRTDPGIGVQSREGSSKVLARGLRAGHLDLALLATAPPFRAPDGEEPPLHLEVLAERQLRVAVSARHPLAAGIHVEVEDLRGLAWIAGQSGADEQLMGVWPGLGGRPVIAHTARDWLAKLNLVAAGLGATTVPSAMPVPDGVKVLEVHGGPRELRRLLLARLPGEIRPATARLAEAIRQAETIRQTEASRQAETIRQNEAIRQN
ncbi:LysR family transcriptional regulator [Dactylosporangium matsuzakiense]|uniref:LysR family transcriptional regulator n=1 Tax=Dactylosporangium matsuzakiense TaxID=53360 RepID=A0A9W6KM12_9ACTN|nr:LysR substrate-binding domain-containing protein [Dactylosporangium matsuzakiense]UWZ43265.1 LysR family transcriptional regulator [Dactylosporangium matsuzakiense]GLL02630.1 LysR family transcriptional regulator [Dactylosporangium matsuzakiense]